MENTLTVQKRFSANALKYIAIVAMLIDHIAWTFEPYIPFDSVLGQLMHIIGRITAPIMCYFIAEGYYHTRNVKNYALRLLIFAILSHFPYVFMNTRTFSLLHSTGVIYTLLLGLLALWAWDKIKLNIIKIPLIILICILANPGDWSCIAVLWVLTFGINRGNFNKQMIGFSVVSLSMIALMTIGSQPFYKHYFMFGVFLAIPLLMYFNGERGNSNKLNKWVFYIFYPLHALILGLIRYYIS